MNKDDKNSQINNQKVDLMNNVNKPRAIRWLRELLIGLVFLSVVGVAVDYFRLSQRDDSVISSAELSVIGAQLTPVQRKAFIGGEPLLVYMWATWCGVCSVTSPAINNMHEDGLLIASVASKSGGQAQLDQLLKSKSYSFPVYADEQGLLSQALAVKGTPSFFIINSKGNILFYSMGINTELGLRAKLAFFK